jgi:hypothetical protein
MRLRVIFEKYVVVDEIFRAGFVMHVQLHAVDEVSVRHQ